MFDEWLGVGGEWARELDLALEDVGLDFHNVVGVERVDAVQHFLNDDAERPPVHGLAVPFVHDDLRGGLLRGAA